MRAARRGGFSLVELLVVLVVMGLLAGLTAVSLSGVGRVAGFREALQQIKFYEKLTRQTARNTPRGVQLVVDLDRNEFARLDAQSGLAAGKGLSLAGSGANLSELMVGGKRFGSGQVSLACSPTGYGPSYALMVQGPQGAKQWLLVVGLTGQVTELANEAQALAAMQAVTAVPTR